MNDLDRLNRRLRTIKLTGLGIVVLTIAVWLIVSAWRVEVNGLLLGEVGGSYVVYSMIRQGHVNDGTQGPILFASGIIGMVTRWAVLAAVIVIAVKVPSINVYAAVVGYMLGFILIIAGLYSYVRNQSSIPGQGR